MKFIRYLSASAETPFKADAGFVLYGETHLKQKQISGKNKLLLEENQMNIHNTGKQG